MNALTYALLLGGLALVAASFVLRLRMARARRGKILLRGIVTESVPRDTRDGRLYLARVSFPYRGETRTVLAGPGRTEPLPAHADVSFRWDPASPDAEAELEGSQAAMGWAMGLSAAGILLELAAVAVMLLE